MVDKWNIKHIRLTHRELWHCANLLKRQSDSGVEGCSYYKLTEVLMRFLAFEAYLNMAGQMVCPDVWKNERRKFGPSSCYQGVLGKAEFLCKELELPKPDRGGRPFQTICKMKKIRDFLSHGRPEVLHDITSSAGRPPSDGMIRVFLENGQLGDIPQRLLLHSREDIEKFADQLQGRVEKRDSRNLLRKKAFEGPMGFADSEPTVE